MDLEAIQNPKFLKRMSNKQLIQLSEQIRQFLIEKLSKTGGHIGPNLGVVELTIALHKVFDSPKDKLIWDVGHQSYVHKILTGRANQFDTLRQYKGLCGFPKRSESEHDVWETGHSSTSLSAAMGMAIARDLKGTNEHIVPIIGDGALTGGMALEALNHIGHEKKDMIVILNDNEMSIAPNVGALHNVLGRLRTAGKYHWVKDELEMLLKKIPAVGGKLAATAERVKDSIKYLLVSGVFFEELGFTYFGPVDGHNFEDLFENLHYAKKTKGPVLVHVITKKEKDITQQKTIKSERGMAQDLIKLRRGISSNQSHLLHRGVHLLVKLFVNWRARIAALSRLPQQCRSDRSSKGLLANFLSVCTTLELQNNMRQRWLLV